MSFPNDLQIASEFAMQGLAAIPQPPQQVTTTTTTTDPLQTNNAMEVDTDMEQIATEPEDKIENVNSTLETLNKEDTIDAAIASSSTAQTAVKKEEGYESSDLELSSDEDDSSDDDSSSDDESSSDEKANEKEQTKNPRKSAQAHDGGDEDDEAFPDGIVKSAHEVIEFVVEKPVFEMTPTTEIILAGNIFQVVNNVIVVYCRAGDSAFSTLDQGSLLVYENREIMGEVFETFGPVARPYYSVRFNDAKEINQEFGKIGAAVFYVPNYQKTHIVETEVLRRIKGTDASNMYDEEISEGEMEFSDDEKEAEHKKKRNKDRKSKNKQNKPSNGNDMEGGFVRGNRGRQERFQARRDPIISDDFDSAMAAYEQSQPQLPPRQQQSYADLYGEPSHPQSNPQYNNAPFQPTQTQQMQTSYQNPEDLVSALFKSYGGSLPTHLPASVTNPLSNNSSYQTAQQPVQQPIQQTSQQAQQQPTQPAQPAQEVKSIKSVFSQPPPSSSQFE